MAASDGRRSPHQQTLFHLIPQNPKATAALNHPDNSQFVSVSATNGPIGLEVGYHVPSISRGDVITSLGRDADLILNQSQFPHKRPPFVSSRHVDFQLNKESQRVMLRVLSEDESSVLVEKCKGVGDIRMGGVPTPKVPTPNRATRNRATRREDRRRWGDRLLLYGQPYLIEICDYSFWLIWVKKPSEQLQALALQRQEIAEPKHVSPFATVHKALDNTTGNNVIVTMIKLGKFGARKNEVRSAIRQEVAFLQKLKHPNIITCLGSRHFETDVPVFYTDLAEGDILHLSKTQTILWPSGLGRKMVRQILDALAYLAENHMSHGSIEPAKILYTYSRTQNKTEIDKYDFQLSHFGISKYAVKPPAQFRAPELWDDYDTSGDYDSSDDNSSDDDEPVATKRVTSKTDVWCLLAAYAATHPRTEGDLKRVSSLSALCQVMVRVRNLWPLFNPMATEDPRQRASATQMIHFLAGLEGPVQPPVAPAPAPPSLGAGGPTDGPAQPPSPPGPASSSLGGGGPTDGPADPGGQKLEQAIIDELGYNLRNRTVTQRAEQRRNAGDRVDKRRNARHRPY